MDGAKSTKADAEIRGEKLLAPRALRLANVLTSDLGSR